MRTHNTRSFTVDRMLRLMPLLFAFCAHGQNEVIVTPIVNPPFSPFLYNYQNQLLVSLTNTSDQVLNLKLVGSIEGDNGYSVRTNVSYLPPQPIMLGIFETRVIQAGSPSLNFFDPGNVTVVAPPSVQNMVQQTGLMPEGNYTLCLRAVDYQTGIPFSDEAPAGCLFFTITHAQPPMITWPFCGDSITTPWPTFTWSPPIGMLAGADIRYDLTLIELLPGQNAVEAMWQALDYNANNPIVRPGLMVPSYPWQPYDPILKQDTWYALAVVAKDLNNAVLIQNQGRSEVCVFMLHDGTSVPPSFQQPVAVATVVQTMQPLHNARLRGRLLYRFKEDGMTTTAPLDVPMSMANTTNLHGWGGTSAPAGEQVLYMPWTGGGSGSPAQAGSWAQMTDLYAAPAGALPPAPSFPTEKFRDPHPVSTDGALPLKHMQVRLVERVVLEDVTITHGNNNLGQHDKVILGVDQPSGLFLDPTMEDIAHGGRVLSVFTTGANGEFIVDYHQLNPTAHQAANVTVAEPYIHHFNDNFQPVWSDVPTVQAGLAYRVLMLEVVSPYYCSPDLEIMAQPGDDVQLPDQAVYVRSYTLRAEVRSDAAKNQAMHDMPLPNVQVKVLRQTSHTPAGIPKNEGQDIEGTFSLSPYGAVPIVAQTITASDGTGTLKNLVRHMPDTPDEYLVVAQTDDTTGSINYATKVKIWSTGKTAADPVVEGGWEEDLGAFAPKPMRNSAFQVKQYKIDFTLHPRAPRVIGRVFASATEVIPGAKVILQLKYQLDPDGSYTCWFCPADTDHPTHTETRTAWTDGNGFFHFDQIPVLTDQVNVFRGPEATLFVSHPGFAVAVRPQSGSKPLLFGEQWDHTGGIFLKPFGKITGTVVDESGKPVKSDVKGGDGPTTRTVTTINYGGGSSGQGSGWQMVQMNTVERFEAPCPSGNNIPILIEPLSDKYFPATHAKNVTAQAGQTQDLGVFMVKEKLHRLLVKVRDDHGTAVAGALVKLDAHQVTTPASGEVCFRFASKDNEFRLKVNAPGQWVPVDTLIVNEVSAEDQVLTIHLKPGAKLAGHVIEKGTTSFVPHARVWVELGNDQYGPILHETIADEIGEYVLDGVPLQTITVHAARQEEGVTWLADAKQVHYIPAPAQGGQPFFPHTKLELQRINGIDISTLIGFKVELEQYQQHNDGTASIGGAFIDLPTNANFKLEDASTRVPFSGVKVKPGALNAQGVPKAEPVATTFLTDATHVAVKLHGGHDMTLEGPPSFLGLGRVAAHAEQDGGAIRGQVSTELSTFKFTYDFDGRFFLGEGPDQPVITVFHSGAAPAKRNYHLMDMGYPQGGGGGWQIAIPTPKDIAFDLRGFSAHADRVKSYVTTDTFSLRTILRIDGIPDMVPGTLDIDVGDVKVMHEDISGIQGGGQQLSFQIGQWQVESTAPWGFDKDLGCITVPSAKLITHRATAEVSGMLLWPDDIDLDADKIGEVRLGDAVPLKASDGTPWTFGYSQGEQAWVLGKAGYAGQSMFHFTGVPKLSPARVDLSAFRLLSNGSEKVTVLESDHSFENIVEFRVQGLDPGVDNVQLQGRPALEMPNFPNATGRIKLTKQGNQIKSDLLPFVATVPTLGKVDFDFLTGSAVSNGKFITNGRLLIWDEQKETYIELVGLLTHTKSGTRIDVIKTNGQQAPGNIEQEVALAGSERLLVRDGQQKTSADQWDELWFDANMKNFKAIDAAQPPMRFVVKGAVSLDKGAIKMDQISTPFGDMTIGYDFKKRMLLGSLTMKHFPSPPLTVHQATLGLMAGGGGFMVHCGDADVTIDILPPLINTLQPGFIIGAHTAVPQDVVANVMAKARNKSLPPQLAANRVNGLFVTAKKPILEVSLPGIDLGVVSAGGHLKTGIDARYWLDLEQGLHVGGLAYFDFKYAVDAAVCELCLALLMELSLSAAVQPGPVFNATGCGVASVSGSLCGVSVSESVSVKAELSSSGGIHVGLGSGGSCSHQSIPSCH